MDFLKTLQEYGLDYVQRMFQSNPEAVVIVALIAFSIGIVAATAIIHWRERRLPWKRRLSISRATVFVWENKLRIVVDVVNHAHHKIKSERLGLRLGIDGLTEAPDTYWIDGPYLEPLASGRYETSAPVDVPESWRAKLEEPAENKGVGGWLRITTVRLSGNIVQAISDEEAITHVGALSFNRIRP